MPLTTTWDDVRYDTNKRADFVNSMLKLLRMAALLKYIMQYPELSKSKPTSHPGKQCEKLISANLMGEDKEIELLAIFLNVKIEVSESPKLKEKHSEMDIELQEDLISKTEGIVRRQYQCHSSFEELVGVRSAELVFNLHSLTNTSNFQKFYDEYFHRMCCVCKKMGIMAMCLFCGEAVCCSYCGAKSKKIEDYDTHSSLLTLTKVGPCSAHAIEKHGGCGAFIHLDEGSVFIYEADRMHEFKDSWINNLGIYLEGSKKMYETFAKYSFNHSLLDTIRSGFLNFNILNMITSYSWKSNTTFRNRFY